MGSGPVGRTRTGTRTREKELLGLDGAQKELHWSSWLMVFMIETSSFVKVAGCTVKAYGVIPCLFNPKEAPEWTDTHITYSHTHAHFILPYTHTYNSGDFYFFTVIRLRFCRRCRQ